MQGFNPYLVDEVVAQSDGGADFFGLISNSETSRPELHGYEVTMSGRLVLPELSAQPAPGEQELGRSKS